MLRVGSQRRLQVGLSGGQVAGAALQAAQRAQCGHAATRAGFGVVKGVRRGA